jgi:hypothetical protein
VRTAFEDAADQFLLPIKRYLSTEEPTCTAFWVYPNEPEQNDEQALARDEVLHYLEAFLSQGFLAAVRGLSEAGRNRLILVLWEEWDGEFSGPYWPEARGDVRFEQIWSGIDSEG